MLLTTDLHFTDKPEDRYRFEIFTYLHELFKETGDKNLLILGDLTDAKDHHSANLVNSIVKRMVDLTEAGMEIFLLKGNHDYIDPDTPFFGFLKHLEWVNYIVDPRVMLIEGKRCLFLPHSRNPIEEWKDNNLVQKQRKQADYVFCHESVIGSVTSSGYEMQQGLLPSYFRRFSGEVYSGDIHCPQTVGKVVYVGTPYSIRFNDHYEGRVLQITGDEVYEHFPQIRRRWTVDISSVDDLCNKLNEEMDWRQDDQIKIRYALEEKDEERWGEIRKELEEECEARHLEISSLQLTRPQRLPLRGKKRDAVLHKDERPSEIVDRFAEKRGITTAQKRAGKKIVEEG